MKERWFDVRGSGGVRLAVRGLEPPSPDKPALLLHHGLASSQRIWDLMLPRLTKRFQVVTFDARGHGRSAKPASGYGFGHTTADARKVIRTIPLGRPIVVGHSWGAMVALALAARHPGSVSGAVLVDGGLGSLSDSMTWPQAKQTLAPPHLDGLHVAEFRAMVRTFLTDQVEVTGAIEEIALSVMRVDKQGRIRPRLSRANHFRILRAIWELDPLELWGRLRVPTLAIGARRPDAPEEERRWTESKRRAAAQVRAIAPPGLVSISWMEGIHDLPLQHPEALARRIVRFSRRS